MAMAVAQGAGRGRAAGAPPGRGGAGARGRGARAAGAAGAAGSAGAVRAPSRRPRGRGGLAAASSGGADGASSSASPLSGSSSPEGVWGGVVRRSGEAALAALQAEHGLGLELFSFEAVESEGRVAIKLDKPDNPYGSPSLDDISLFTQVLRARLELALGEELAGRVEVEVSSPGADRHLKLPGELRRFGELPLLVKYRAESLPGAGKGGEGGGKGGEDAGRAPPPAREDVLALLDIDEEAGTAEWELADVRANRRRKNSKAARKKRAGGPELGQPFTLPLASLISARLHIDI